MARVMIINFFNFDLPPKNLLVPMIAEATTAGISGFRESGFRDLETKAESGTARTAVYLLKDNPTFEFGSTFQTIGDLFSLAQEIQGIVNLLNSASGSVSNNLNNIFNAQMWKDTSPLKISTKLILTAKRSALCEVMYEAYCLSSHTIISEIPRGAPGNPDAKTFYKIPGLSLGQLGLANTPAKPPGEAPTNLQASDKAGAEEILAKGGSGKSLNVRRQAKYISLRIPGLLYVPFMQITNAKPTFSLETDSKGSSTWAEIDFEVTSVEPAKNTFMHEMFGDQTEKLPKTGLG